MDIRNKIILGNNLETSRLLPRKSLHTGVTSPPYYNLRDYGADGQLGREDTPRAFVENLVTLFDEEHFGGAIRDDGTLWVNLGDSYNNGATIPADPQGMHGEIKQGDLIGTPMMFAYAMRSSGWYLRSIVIWEKPTGKPESTYDRPTNNHEYFFLFTKTGVGQYYYDWEAIADPYIEDARELQRRSKSPLAAALGIDVEMEKARKKNCRSVWHEKLPEIEELLARYPQELVRECMLTLTGMLDLELPPTSILKDKAANIWKVRPQLVTGGHPAPYPPELVMRPILAGCPKGGIVGDPFFGSANTGRAAIQYGRHFLGLELNPDFALDMAYEKVGGEVIHFVEGMALTYERDENVEQVILARRKEKEVEVAVEKPAKEKVAKEKVEKAPREAKPKVEKPKKLTAEDRLKMMEL